MFQRPLLKTDGPQSSIKALGFGLLHPQCLHLRFGHFILELLKYRNRLLFG